MGIRAIFKSVQYTAFEFVAIFPCTGSYLIYVMKFIIDWGLWVSKIDNKQNLCQAGAILLVDTLC